MFFCSWFDFKYWLVATFCPERKVAAFRKKHCKHRFEEFMDIMSDRVYECCIFCNKEHLTDIPYQRHYQRRIKKGVYWSSKRGCYYDYDRIAEYFTHK